MLPELLSHMALRARRLRASTLGQWASAVKAALDRLPSWHLIVHPVRPKKQ